MRISDWSSDVCASDRSVACSPLAQGSANRCALLASTALDPGRSARHCWLMAEETYFSSLSVEDALKRLEAIVQQLESGDVPLDQSITLYAEGDLLRQQCQKRLQDAQARIDKIALGSDGSVAGTTPFGTD